MWLPEGFVLTDLKELPVAGGTSVFGKFENGSSLLLITYRISTDITAKMEKDETGVELFEFGAVNHFIVDNDDNLSVTWKVDGVECSILADIAKDDLYNIIKSIYRRKLE